MIRVFNLVTQQDAATSATEARKAKADGNSMKVIAALTMVFFPGTFLSSVSGPFNERKFKGSGYMYC